MRRFTDSCSGLYSKGNGARFSALRYADKSLSSNFSAALSLLSASNFLLIFSNLPLMHVAGAYRSQAEYGPAATRREHDEAVTPARVAANRQKAFLALRALKSDVTSVSACM